MVILIIFAQVAQGDEAPSGTVERIRGLSEANTSIGMSSRGSLWKMIPCVDVFLKN